MACYIKMNIEQEKCFKIIREQLNRYYYINDSVQVENKILGYLGRYYYLSGREIDSENPSKSRDVTFFLKIMPSDERQKNFIEKSGVFDIEMAIYTLIFPKMILPENFAPKCILHMKNNFLVLEHMSFKGFQMLNKFLPLKLNYCQMVLKALGSFHAKSIIFEHKNQQNVLEFLKEKGIDLHSPDFSMQEAIITDINGVCSIIDSIIMKDNNTEGWEKVKKTIKKESEGYYEKLKSSKDKKVLCHSDLWSNNILFKLDSDLNPIECCLVDFQLSRYASPALDILICLQFTTSRKLRNEHFQDLIKSYYNSLASTLEEEGLDIKNFFPWFDLLKSIESLKLTCMTGALAYMSIDLLESDPDKKGAVTQEQIWNHLSRDTAPLVLKHFEEVSDYKDRILDSLIELYELLTEKTY